MVAIYMGHRLTYFDLGEGQIGKEFSHSWHSGKESVGAHYSSKPPTGSDLSLTVLYTLIAMVTLV